MQIYRTTRSCTVPITGYEAARMETAFGRGQPPDRPARARVLNAAACHRLLHRPPRVAAFAVTHSRCLRSCSVLGGVIKPPLPSFLTPTSVQQGSFAPRALPRFLATASPAATVSSSADFPGSPVIRPTWLRRFLERDEDGFSSCSICPCHRAAPPSRRGQAAAVGSPWPYPPFPAACPCRVTVAAPPSPLTDPSVRD